jgi:hypothetical protein
VTAHLQPATTAGTKQFGCTTNSLSATAYVKQLKELQFDLSMASFTNGTTPFIRVQSKLFLVVK